jgi:hypothetical protein
MEPFIKANQYARDEEECIVIKVATIGLDIAKHVFQVHRAENGGRSEVSAG